MAAQVQGTKGQVLALRASQLQRPGALPSLRPHPTPPPHCPTQLLPWTFLVWPLFLMEMRLRGRHFLGGTFIGPDPKGGVWNVQGTLALLGNRSWSLLSLSNLLAVNRTSQPPGAGRQCVPGREAVWAAGCSSGLHSPEGRWSSHVSTHERRPKVLSPFSPSRLSAG